MHKRWTLVESLALLALLVACSSGKTAGFGSSDASALVRDAREASVVPEATGQDVPPPCTDCDHDGYTAPADCNDTDPQVNPEAYDFIGDGIDNDCDGTVDNPVVTCETIPKTAPGDPTDFARASDLCAQRSLTHTGHPFDPLVRAAWGQVQGYGPGQSLWTSMTKPEQVNIVSAFGQNAARTGQTMFGLSNGPWGTTTPRTSAPLDPAGFRLDDACSDIPLVGSDCQSLTGNAPASGISVQDWAELTLWVQVPVNATTMSFDFAFFSSEFNQFWQSAANDAFFVLVSSQTLKGTNVAKDAHGLGITVNSGFFQLCPAPPGPAGLSQDKAAGIQQCVGVAGTPVVKGTLAGTGFDGASVGSDDTVLSISQQKYIYGGGSGWLQAVFAVTPGEQLQMRVVIMDTFDGLKDSVVLMDGMTWGHAAQTGVARLP